MRTPAAAAVAIAVATLALAPAGCSFRLAVPPPAPGEWPRPGQPHGPQERCTPSVVPPLLDTTATAVLLGAAYAETRFPSRWPPITLGVASIPVAISAVYGYIVAVECRRYQRLFLEPAPTP
jgi:hypothetical protein